MPHLDGQVLVKIAQFYGKSRYLAGQDRPSHLPVEQVEANEEL